MPAAGVGSGKGNAVLRLPSKTIVFAISENIPPNINNPPPEGPVGPAMPVGPVGPMGPVEAF